MVAKSCFTLSKPIQAQSSLQDQASKLRDEDAAAHERHVQDIAELRAALEGQMEQDIAAERQQRDLAAREERLAARERALEARERGSGQGVRDEDGCNF